MGRHPLNFELQCKKLLCEVMKLTHGNRSQAAKILGLSNNTVRNWIRKYRLTQEFNTLYGEESAHYRGYRSYVQAVE
jgi:transposase